MSTTATTIDPEHQLLGEVEIVGRDRWEEIRRRAGAGASIRAIARELDLDRKTVRRLLRQKQWKPYQRTALADTLLASHAAYLRRRAAEVGYSAQVLYQELRRRQYGGGGVSLGSCEPAAIRRLTLYSLETLLRRHTRPTRNDATRRTGLLTGLATSSAVVTCERHVIGCPHHLQNTANSLTRGAPYRIF